MQIRPDFTEAEIQLQRLAQFAHVFNRNNHEHWSHLKNRADFDSIYQLTESERNPLEQIYATGRDLAVHMSAKLSAFNWPEQYSTLKRYVDSFDGGWLHEIHLLKEESRAAKEMYASLTNKPWAVGQMIKLYDEQIALLEDVDATLNELRKTDLYSPRQEKELPAKRDSFALVYDLALLILGDPKTRFATGFVIAGTILISAPWWQTFLQQALANHLELDIAILDTNDPKLFWSGWIFVGIGISLYIWIKRTSTPQQSQIG